MNEITSTTEQWGVRWHALQRDLASEAVLRWPERSMVALFGGRDGSWLARASDARSILHKGRSNLP